MRSFIKDRVATVASEEEWEAALARSGDRLLVIEFAASWSEPCKAMTQVVGALARQVEYSGVDFARVDLEACPALGAKKAVMAAPTYHYYRSGQLLASFSGAMPNRLVELLDTHKGETHAKRGGRKLLTLLGVLLAGGACIAFFNAQTSKPASPPPVAAPNPPPPQDDAAGAGAGDAAARADGEPTRELQPPAKKQASSPSKGARRAR